MIALAAATCSATASVAQSIDAVNLTELSRHQFPYVQFPAGFSAPVLSSRIDRLDRPYVYLACRDSGLYVWDISTPTSAGIVKRMLPAGFGGHKVINLEQYGDLLYAVLGELDSGTPGLAVLDISDPADPQLLGQYNHLPFTHGGAIVQVQGNYAYIGAMADGILVLDISDPADPQYHGSYQPDPAWPGIASYPPNARGMVIADTIMYLAYDAGGLRVLSISDPAAPFQLAQYLNPQHPALTNVAYNNVKLLGDRLFLATDFCGLEVLDVSNPLAPTQLEWLNPWGCFGLSWFGSDGHANELVLALNDSLLVMSAGDSEVLVYDITDPDLPELKGGHIFPNDTAAAWGVDVHGDLVVGGFINNNGLAFQPFNSKFGGALLFQMDVDLVTAVAGTPVDRAGPRLWPQPASGPLRVHWPGVLLRSTGAHLFDASGRELKIPVSIDADGLLLDLSGQGAGHYTLRLSAPEGTRILPVMVAR